MMMFGIDVRRRICRGSVEWMNFVNMKTEIELKKKDELDPETIENLEEIDKILDCIIETKKEEMKKEIESFEKDFAKDIFENEGFYKDIILKDQKEA